MAQLIKPLWHRHSIFTEFSLSTYCSTFNPHFHQCTNSMPQVSGLLYPNVRLRRNCRLLVLAWTSSDDWGQLENESADRSSLSLSFHNPPFKEISKSLFLKAGEKTIWRSIRRNQKHFQIKQTWNFQVKNLN